MEIIRKKSKKRNAVLEVLCATKTHPTAQWIFENAKKLDPDISVATVYRNLRQLKEDGEIISVGQVFGEERFDGINTPHPHFICQTCGNVLDLDFNENDFKNFSVGDNIIDFRKTCFYGKCKNCNKN